MKLEEFAKFFENIMYAYYNNPQMQKTIIYYHLLKDYPIEVVKNAFTNIIKKSKFFPSVSDIIEEIEGNGENTAFIWYIKVIYVLENIGPYKSIVFDNPIVNAVIDALGGWVELSKTPISQKEKLKNDFIKLYTVFENMNIKMDKVKGLTDETIHIKGIKNDTKKAIT